MTCGTAPAEDGDGTEGLEVVEFDTFDFGFYGYNTDPAKTTVFQDKEVRQALFTALDRQLIIDNIFLGYGEVAVGTQPVLSIAYNPEGIDNPYTYDLDAANALLDQAAWTDTDGDGIREKNGTRLAFEMIFTAGVATYEQLVPYMQEQWRQVGAEMTPNGVQFPALLEAINQTHDFDMVLLGFSWDASGSQTPMFACDQYDGGFNFVRYCNPAFDELDEQASHELDPAKRVELLTQAANIAWDDLPMAIYRFAVDPTGYNAAMHNFYPNDYTLLWSRQFVWVEAA